MAEEEHREARLRTTCRNSTGPAPIPPTPSGRVSRGARTPPGPRRFHWKTAFPVDGSRVLVGYFKDWLKTIEDGHPVLTSSLGTWVQEFRARGPREDRSVLSPRDGPQKPKR